MRITRSPLSAQRAADAVRSPGAGAIVIFEGTTRDVDRLEYDAYIEMAEERITVIVRDAIARHGLEAATAEHRIGSVPLSQPSVIVAVAAAHRAPAFDGAREILDRIKAEAPIWKREVEGARRSWVEGSPAPKNPL